MNAILDQIDAQIAEMRRDISAPDFRVRTAKERRNALRVEIANLIPGSPIASPDLGPPSKKSIRANAVLFGTLRRLERAALALRNI
jgi:hypothetical protein